MPYEKVIVDSDWILDPKVARASDILMAEGKGLMGFRGVDVVVDGTKRFAVEVDLDNERGVILDAVRRAGLTVLENAEKVEQ